MTARPLTDLPPGRRPGPFGRLLYSPRMGEDEAQADGSRASEQSPGGDREPLRRGIFGYRRADVNSAFGSRDAQLAELRQDVAALWLAFAQHDRMIRAALALPERGHSPERAEAPPKPPSARASSAEPEMEDPASINQQLSELDDVLAAIESATQTLERTYAEEISPGAEAAPDDESAGNGPAEGDAPGPPAAGERP